MGRPFRANSIRRGIYITNAPVETSVNWTVEMIEALKQQIRASQFLWNPKDPMYQNIRRKQQFLAETAALLNAKFNLHRPFFTSKDIQLRCAQMKIRRRRFVGANANTSYSLQDRPMLNREQLEINSSEAPEIIVPGDFQQEPDHGISVEQVDETMDQNDADQLCNPPEAQPSPQPIDSELNKQLKEMLVKQGKMIDLLSTDDTTATHAKFCQYLSKAMEELDNDLVDQIVQVSMQELLKVRKVQRERDNQHQLVQNMPPPSCSSTSNTAPILVAADMPSTSANPMQQAEIPFRIKEEEIDIY